MRRIPLEELGEAARLALGLEQPRPLERHAGLLGHTEQEQGTVVVEPVLPIRCREDRPDRLPARSP